MKNATFVSVLLTLLIASLFFAVSAGPVATPMHGPQVSSFTASKGIQPYATMNTNITWSDFNSGWAWNEYNNGTSNLSLNTEVSNIYQNPITVNPSDIVAPGILQGNKIGTLFWNNTANWQNNIAPGGAHTTISSSTYNGVPIIKITLNSTKSESTYTNYVLTIPLSSLPSNNLAYDYITMITGTTGTNQTGATYGDQIVSIPTTGTTHTPSIPLNQSTQMFSKSGALHENIGQIEYTSVSLAQMNTLYSSPIFNTSGSNPTINVELWPAMQLPAENGTNDTLTIYGLALTNYPITFGINANGSKPEGTLSSTVSLKQLAPSFTYKSIQSGGYTVATTQPLQNVTKTQIAIQNGSYIEEVQKQGQFILPSAPDLTYGPANITETMNVSSSQVMVLDINGLSYLSATASRKRNK